MMWEQVVCDFTLIGWTCLVGLVVRNMLSQKWVILPLLKLTYGVSKRNMTFSL